MYTSLGILAMIILISIVGLFYIHKTVSELNFSLNEVTESIVGQNYANAEKSFDKFYNLWNKKAKTLVILIRHFDVDYVSNTVSEMKSFLKYGDYSAFMARAAVADEIINRIWNDEIPTIKNIL